MKSKPTKSIHNIIITILPITLIASACLSTTQAAPPWAQVRKLLASDGAQGNRFGTSVATSGNLIVVGAESDDDNGTDSGSAYVFDETTGQQLFKLLALDGRAGDNFGISVAADGNLAVIGALNDDSIKNGPNSGSAYVFDITTGRQLVKLVAADGFKFDQFGFSVAMSGNLAVIGSRFNDNENGFAAGSAYVFDVTTGQQLFKLIPDDGLSRENFGMSVAVSGNIAVVGTQFGHDNGIQTGAAYVFDLTSGLQVFKLLPQDRTSGGGGLFGRSVALNGNISVIGAVGDDDNGPESGSAYVFDVTTGQQNFKLHAADGEGYDSFGESVAISGNQAVIGATGDSDNSISSGSAYVFDVTTGQQLFKLLTSDGAIDDYFGDSVAISNNLVVIGSFRDSVNGPGSGSTYIFEPRTTNYLTADPMPLMAGQDATFSLVQTLPNEQTWLLYSLRGLKRIFIPQLNITIDLKRPKIAAGPQLTDANGNLQIVMTMPTITNPLNVWFQAVQNNNVTNFIPTQLIP